MMHSRIPGHLHTKWWGLQLLSSTQRTEDRTFYNHFSSMKRRVEGLKDFHIFRLESLPNEPANSTTNHSIILIKPRKVGAQLYSFACGYPAAKPHLLKRLIMLFVSLYLPTAWFWRHIQLCQYMQNQKLKL